MKTKDPSKMARIHWVGASLPKRNVKTAPLRAVSIMDTREAEARFNRFIAEYQAMALAQSIIARIQDQSYFYHFWHQSKEKQ